MQQLRWLPLSLGGLYLAILAGCQNGQSPSIASGSALESASPNGDAASSAPGYFADMTQTSGIDFVYRSGEEAGNFAILESLGGGVGQHSLRDDGAGSVGRCAGHRGGDPRRNRGAIAAGTAQPDRPREQ